MKTWAIEMGDDGAPDTVVSDGMRVPIPQSVDAGRIIESIRVLALACARHATGIATCSETCLQRPEHAGDHDWELVKE